MALTVVALAGVTVVTGPAVARTARGVKKLAMARFNVSAREIGIVAKANATSQGDAVVVRLLNTDVPVCQLLILDARAAAATKIVTAIRLPVCAAYTKESRDSRVTRVQLTNGRSAYRVNLNSRRMDAIAKGVETLALWGLYADMGTGFRAVFERTSTSFKSQVNNAVNQAETCSAPTFAVSVSPTTLTIACTTVRMLGGAATRKTATVPYQWQDGRFALR